MVDDPETLHARASSVLVRAPAMADEREGACVDLLAPPAVDEVRVVAVVLQGTPGEWLERWRGATDVSLADLRMVSVSGGSVPVGSVATVDAPDDLTGLEITTTDALSTLSGDEVPVRLCFESLTTLVECAEPDAVYRYLHTLTELLWSLDAVGHFHVDPAAHGEATIGQLLPLFDAVVSHGEEWSVDSRPLVRD